MSAAAKLSPALHHARLYSARGWSVVPVRSGEKIPAAAWARYQLTPADDNQLMAWFAETFPGCGLVQGRNAGTIVLDFDASTGGMETLAQLDAKGLPPSVRCFTPSGGCHVYLKHPGQHVPTRKQVLPGMDVRGDGGFVVAPPSVGANGVSYEWDVDAHFDECAVSDCPEWVAALICGPQTAGPGEQADIVRVEAPGALGLPVERVADGREQYMRDTILAVTRGLRDILGRLPTEQEVFDEGWAQYAARVDFSRPGRGADEFRRKVAYTLARVRQGLVRGFLADGAEAPEAKQVAPAGDRSPLPLLYFKDTKPNLDAADFVEGLLIEGAMSVVYGPSNCGKTFFMTDVSLHVATGRAWRGREIEPGGVIYCALEGSHGISNRLEAFKREHGLEGVEVPFAVIPVAINLLDPNADRARLVETIRMAAEEMGCPVKLIVIDTLSRALAGGNENAPDDMGAIVASADYIRQAAKGHLAFIHHSGKDQAQGARGHSLLRAATDTEIEISRESADSPSVARVTKQRELEIEGVFQFRLKVVELGTNRRGKPVTSCVVEHEEGGTSEARPMRLSFGSKAALLALSEALAKSGASVTMSDIPANVLVVPLATWRAEFYARSSLDEQQAKRRAFQRGVQDLTDRQLAVVIHDRAWLVRDKGAVQ